MVSHLQGFVTLGAYALDADSQAHWICLDADTADQWRRLLAMAEILQKQQMAPYSEPSRRGGHLWLFLPTVLGREARLFGRQLQAEHNLEDVELYPSKMN